jgi:NADH-quinone oxidoreductase subunit I
MLGIVKAIGTTVRAALRRPVTVQYPTEKKVLPHRSRGFPVLLWDFEKDEPFCTGCQVCARYCPGKSKRKKTVDAFYLDYARCMRCDICVEVCNFDAIVMNNTYEGFELSRYDRQDLVMSKEDLLRQHRTGDLEDPFREPMGVAHSGWNPHKADEEDDAAEVAAQPQPPQPAKATAAPPEARSDDPGTASEKSAEGGEG